MSAKPFSRAKNCILGLYDGAKKTLKDIVEKEVEEGGIDLTPHEHERALNRAYISFVMPGKPKEDIDSYFNQAEPHIKALIEK